MKNSFFLVIPEQKTDSLALASFGEVALQQWLAELPTANLGLSTRLFQDLLAELISLDMPAAKRLAALEQLRPRFLLIEDYLRLRLMRSGFPKNEVENKIFSLLMILEKQFTIGYWSVTKELTKREIGWLQSKTALIGIHRTIKGLSSIVISHYMMNYPVPDWVWFDLHSLYKLALKLGKETTKVNEQTGLFGKSETIEDSYKQILLLSLAYPSGLMQKEFVLVYEFIGKISELISIEKQPVADQPIHCRILLDEDLPPSFIQNLLDVGDKRSESLRLFLNLSKLDRLIKNPDKYCSKDEVRFSVIEAERKPEQKLSVELFDYLIHRWQGKAPSGTAMFVDRLDRLLAIGLENTHALQDPHYKNLDGFEIAAETFSERALSVQLSIEGALSIGSLVSIRKTDVLAYHRCLGVVCNLSLSKQHSRLIFETSVIAEQSFSVSYRYQDANDDGEQHKALLYGKKIGDDERSYIILESFMVKNGDILRMYMGHESFPIILNRRSNIGLGYWQFECRRILEKPGSLQEKKKGYDFI